MRGLEYLLLVSTSLPKSFSRGVEGWLVSAQNMRIFYFPSEYRLVKVEKGTARRTGYVQAASEAATERAKEIENTRLVAEDAR